MQGYGWYPGSYNYAANNYGPRDYWSPPSYPQNSSPYLPPSSPPPTYPPPYPPPSSPPPHYPAPSSPPPNYPPPTYPPPNVSPPTTSYIPTVAVHRVLPDIHADDSAERALSEIRDCKILFATWGDKLDDKLPHKKENEAIHQTIFKLRNEAQSALIASQSVVRSHHEFCWYMSNSLKQAASSGELRSDQSVLSAGQQIRACSDALCGKIQCMQDDLRFLLKELEKLVKAKQKGQTLSKILKWLPELLATIGHALTGAIAVIGIVHPIGLAASGIIASISTFASAGSAVTRSAAEANKLRETHVNQLLSFLQSQLPEEIRKAGQMLTAANAFQLALQVHVEIQTSRLLIMSHEATFAAQQWDHLGDRLRAISVPVY